MSRSRLRPKPPLGPQSPLAWGSEDGVAGQGMSVTRTSQQAGSRDLTTPDGKDPAV